MKQSPHSLIFVFKKVLIFFLILFLFWRRNKTLKKRLRDLTKEEVEEFMLGTLTDPNDIHAPIDLTLEIPKEQIELGKISFSLSLYSNT